MGRLRRHPWRTATGALVAAGLIAFGIVWFAPQALFINTSVDEPLPVTAAMVSGTAPAAPSSPATAVPQPQTLVRGDFRSLEHHTTGSAQLLRLADGTVVLRIEDLDTSNGPDVRVTLSPTPSDRGDRDYGEHLDLGALKGNKGSQNYAVPAGTDLGAYRSVVIWCRRFSVGFGVAPIA
jgi:Electron transfer DM13